MGRVPAVRVSDSSRVLFVHVPKTGGSTIDAFFDQEVDDVRRLDALARHSPYGRILRHEPGLADYWSFGFVRNPWARLVSWWSMVKLVFDNADAGNEHALRRFEKNPNAWVREGEFRHDFRAFVLQGTETIPKVARPQVRTLTGARGRRVDFVGRTETFDHDMAVVRERLGLPVIEAAPRANETTHAHYSEYYDDETRSRVAEVFADDIEAFGYSFDEL
jgi:Sulfotransferase family